jgi:threonine aldolase
VGAALDSLSVCFSKGLGAPVGSALAGPREFVARARRIRKLFGGGMRQAGMIASAALYALENHVQRLAEDHKNAQVLARAVADTPGLRLDPPEVDTNLVWFQVDPDLGTAKDVAAALKQRGVLVHPAAPQRCRACTHLDVSAAQAEQAAETIRQAVPRLVPAR